jgi:hypothetical protein
MVKSIRKKLINALRVEFGEVTDALDRTPAGRILGAVVIPSLQGSSHEIRQRKLKRALTKSLSRSELESVGPIVVLTPAEFTVKSWDD